MAPAPFPRLDLQRLVPVQLRRARKFYLRHGRLPPVMGFETFNDKVQWRITRDRRDLLRATCDKLAMKEHAARLAPDLTRTPETYWFGTDVAELRDVDLPENWVLKPNHASQRVIISGGPADVEKLAVEVAGWVDEPYWRRSGEWAYRTARPGLLVEEFIGTPGEVPADLKLFVFDGQPRAVAVHSKDGAVHKARYYTTDWEPMPWTGGYVAGPDTPRPERLEDMLKAASLLAQDFDMMRVDFYEHDGVLWFGELTPYPAAGLARYEPELDRLLGSWWQLPVTGRRGLLPLR
ncbi:MULTISPECIES: ATP-grasp fold amidoligase family protein [Modestobacter]|uniref:ATP-grasp fold amidoligase family protein n=1 Tax=Modestobacter TaxID=88138 RepID=UPI00068CADBC|nr:MULTISPECIES: ATP-grasp fold amidoligase family protein [Modestobacter]